MILPATSCSDSWWSRCTKLECVFLIASQALPFPDTHYNQFDTLLHLVHPTRLFETPNIFIANQVEEAFGACLSSVAARAHIDAALPTPSAAAVEVDCDIHARDAGDWEHVPLFDEPDPGQQQLAGTAAALAPSPSPPAPASDQALTCNATQWAEKPVQAPIPASSTTRTTDPAPANLKVRPSSPPGSDADEARAAALFRRLRRRLARMRRYNRTARFREAREQAAAVLAAAAAAGCQGVAEWAARMLGRAGYVPAAALDDLELRIDTAEAAWAALRRFV